MSHAVQCDFCKHWYIMPCTDNEQEKCPNMIWLRSQGTVPAQQSLRHHYIPQFYSKRWGGEDFKITQFSRPYKTVQAKQVLPVQTGFADRLYEMKNVPPSAAQRVEDEFIVHWILMRPSPWDYSKWKTAAFIRSPNTAPHGPGS